MWRFGVFGYGCGNAIGLGEWGEFQVEITYDLVIQLPAILLNLFVDVILRPKSWSFFFIVTR